jgi:hypothetical protein
MGKRGIPLEQAGTDPEEQVMEVLAVWEERGIVKGKQEMVLLQLRGRFGDAMDAFADRVRALEEEKVDAFGGVAFDFRSVDDIEAWLAKNA